MALRVWGDSGCGGSAGVGESARGSEGVQGPLFAGTEAAFLPECAERPLLCQGGNPHISAKAASHGEAGVKAEPWLDGKPAGPSPKGEALSSWSLRVPEPGAGWPGVTFLLVL